MWLGNIILATFLFYCVNLLTTHVAFNGSTKAVLLGVNNERTSIQSKFTSIPPQNSSFCVSAYINLS